MNVVPVPSEDRIASVLLDTSKPGRVVEMFEDCSGDVDEFLARYRCTANNRTKILFKVQMMLDEPANAEHKARWEKAAQAFHKTQLTLARREALDRIKEMQKVRPTAKNQRDQMAYTKFILQDLMTAEIHKAKKNVDRQIKEEEETEPEDDFFAEKAKKLGKG